MGRDHFVRRADVERFACVPELDLAAPVLCGSGRPRGLRREARTVADLAGADFELPWLSEWAGRSPATGFHPMTIDILRGIATDSSVALR